MPRVSSSKGNKAALKPLKDITCYVETYNEDGTDASESTIKVLETLGATVDPVFKMGLTHMIWSNGNLKHVKAAEFMDIVVVSPLWVENCREAGRKVAESDFFINPDSNSAGPSKKSIVEPLVKPASSIREPDSPSFSSSQIIASGTHPLRVLDQNTICTIQGNIKAKKQPKQSNNRIPVSSPEDENHAPSRPVSAKRGTKTPVLTSSASSLRAKSPHAVLDKQGDSAGTPRQSPRLKSPSEHEESPSASTRSKSNSAAKLRTSLTSIKESQLVSTKNKKAVTVKRKKNASPSDNVAVVADRSDIEESDYDDDVPPPPISSKSTKAVGSKAPKEKAPETSMKTAVAKSKPPSASASTAAAKDKKKSMSGADRNEVRSVALSGFEGEQRVMLGDILLGLCTSDTMVSSSSSSSSAGTAGVDFSADDDSSLKALLKPSHVIAESENPRRTLRVLFGLARGIPIVNEQWVYHCLEQQKWVTDCAPFLHSRFGRSAAVAKPRVDTKYSVFVGPCSDPARSTVKALLTAWSLTECVSDIQDAEFIIIDSSPTGLPQLRKEISANGALAEDKLKYLDKKLSSGHVIKCKDLFDCIEQNDLLPKTSKLSKSSSSSGSTNSTTSTIKKKTVEVASTNGAIAGGTKEAKLKSSNISLEAVPTKSTTKLVRKSAVPIRRGITSEKPSKRRMDSSDEDKEDSDGGEDDDNVGIVISLDAGQSPSFEPSFASSATSGSSASKKQRITSTGRGSRGGGKASEGDAQRSGRVTTPASTSSLSSSGGSGFHSKRLMGSKSRLETARLDGGDLEVERVPVDDGTEVETILDKQLRKRRSSGSAPGSNRVSFQDTHEDIPPRRVTTKDTSDESGVEEEEEEAAEEDDEWNEDDDGWMHNSSKVSRTGSLPSSNKRPLGGPSASSVSSSENSSAKKRRQEGSRLIKPAGRSSDQGASDSDGDWEEDVVKTTFVPTIETNAPEMEDYNCDDHQTSSSVDVPSPSW